MSPLALVALTNAELNLLVTVVNDSVREGSYYGNREQWERRRAVVLRKLMEAEPVSGDPYASVLGKRGGMVKTEAKARAARENAKKGGWPKGRKRGP